MVFNERLRGSISNVSKIAEVRFLHKLATKTWKTNNKEKKRISDIIVHNIVEKMCQQYDALPLCHLEKIVRKYVNCRLQRWGKFQNKEWTTKNKAVIFSEAHSSRSTAAQVTIH